MIFRWSSRTLYKGGLGLVGGNHTLSLILQDFELASWVPAQGLVFNYFLDPIFALVVKIRIGSIFTFLLALIRGTSE